MTNGKIIKVSGPLVVAEGLSHANMFDVVRVGQDKLIGEIIEMRGDRASIQVYEETAGIGYGDEVATTGAPLSVELAPGLIENIYDGIQRPLEKIREIAGSNINRGIDVKSVDREREWDFTPSVKVGDKVTRTTVLGIMGRTGNVTGIHLHYQLNDADNQPVDPTIHLGIPNKKGEYNSEDFGIMNFKDSDKIADWAKASVEKLSKLGLMVGDEKGNFNPEQYVTRQEFATVIAKLVEGK